MGKYREEKVEKQEYKELPYTVVSHSSLLPEFTITLTAAGVKELIKDCHDEDLIHITVRNQKRTTYEISKYIEG